MAAIYLANSGAPTHTLSADFQHVGGGGGTDTWTADYDIRDAGLAAQTDTTSGAAKLTCRKSGMYLVTLTVRFTSITDAKILQAVVYVNGANTGLITAITTGVATSAPAKVVEVVSLVAGDTLEPYAWQNDSASEAYTTTTKHDNKLTMTYIGRSS